MTKTPINTKSIFEKWKRIKKNYSPMIQLNLFPNTIKQAFMIAQSQEKPFTTSGLKNGMANTRSEKNLVQIAKS